MTFQHRSLGSIGLVLGVLLLVVVGCGDKSSSGNSTGNPELPADPGPGNLAGIVYGTVGGQPLAGVAVSAKGLATTTDATGVFRLNNVGNGTLGVELRGNAIYPRRAVVNTDQQRSVRLEAIETNSSFNLAFYRELARGNLPSEQALLPGGKVLQTHRWTTTAPPTFIINTDASTVVGNVVTQAKINAARDVLAAIVPVFTGGFYQAPAIRVQEIPPALLQSLDDLPDNTFMVKFDDTLMNRGWYGVTLTQADFTSATASVINKAFIAVVHDSQFYQDLTFEEDVAHEAGHGFGFRHTAAILPSVMLPIGTFGGLYSIADQLHMKIMYRRPAGNTDLDDDPLPGTKVRGQARGVQAFVDRRGNFPPLPAELLAHIRALPPDPLLSRYVPEQQ